MTPQEIFNKVCEHLIKQGRKAESGDGSCKYWDPETDAHCAVGCLIPPDHYDPEIEGLAIHSVMKPGALRTAKEEPKAKLLEEALRAGGVEGEESYRLLDALQGVHDNCIPSTWRKELRRCAVGWKLEMPNCIKQDGEELYSDA